MIFSSKICYKTWKRTEITNEFDNLGSFCRGEKTRTSDLHVPNVAR